MKAGAGDEAAECAGALCPVCCEALSGMVAWLPCDHAFHEHCIKKWLSQASPSYLSLSLSLSPYVCVCVCVCMLYSVWINTRREEEALGGRRAVAQPLNELEQSRWDWEANELSQSNNRGCMAHLDTRLHRCISDTCLQVTKPKLSRRQAHVPHADTRCHASSTKSF